MRRTNGLEILISSILVFEFSGSMDGRDGICVPLSWVKTMGEDRFEIMFQQVIALSASDERI